MHDQAAEVRSRLVLCIILVIVWLRFKRVASMGHIEIEAILRIRITTQFQSVDVFAYKPHYTTRTSECIPRCSPSGHFTSAASLIVMSRCTHPRPGDGIVTEVRHSLSTARRTG